VSRKRFEIVAWIAYVLINASVNASSVLVDYARNGIQIENWEPFIWEYSSGILILVLIPCVIWFDQYYPLRKGQWKKPLLFHVLASVPFSLAHVAGMVALRKLVYALQGRHYDFGNVPVEFFYEYRKDFLSYFFIIAVVYAYRLYSAKTAGAAYGFNPPITNGSKHFFVKKNGRSVRINQQDIIWVEAAGNYVLLHVGESVHPLRDTMKGIAEQLGPSFLRIHRSAIVNLSKVGARRGTRGGNLTVFLDDSTEIKCSRSARAELERQLASAHPGF